MSKIWEDTKYFLFLFLVTLLFSYIVGITIITVINNRFKEISINLPPINLPTGQPQPAEPNASSQPETIQENFTLKPILNPSSNLNYTNDDLRGFIAQKEYADCTEATSQIQQEKMIQMNDVCLMQHDHKKYMCHYGRTNYMNPADLDPVNQRIYKYNYFQNMTLQDYINWLQLWKDDGEKLTYEHFKNLEKLRQSKPLHYEKGICPPLVGPFKYNASSPVEDGAYFQKMMTGIGLDLQNNCLKDPKGFNYLDYRQ